MSKEAIKPCAILPIREISRLDDVSVATALRWWPQYAEGLGFDGLVVYDHIIFGAEPGGNRYNTYERPYHELFTTLGFLAGQTQRSKLISGVLVLPQRQTALVARQAADIAMFSGNRLILGVGVGSNETEFQALGAGGVFSQRGQRIEEQIRLLRQLWTGKEITYQGPHENFERVALNPVPNIPIPIWIGGWADRALQRTALMADGYIPLSGPNELRPLIDPLRGYLDQAGKDPGDFPIMAGFGQSSSRPTPAELMHTVKQLEGMGVSHVAFGTQGFGFTRWQEHQDYMLQFMEAFRSRD